MESMETPVYEPFHVQVRMEIAKLRQMGFKAKLEYIWEYYKLLLAGIVVFFFIVGSILNAWVFNPNPQTALFIQWSSDFMPHEELDFFADLLTEHLVEDGVNETVIATMFFDNPDDPQMMMAMVTQRMAMLAAGELDIFVQNAEQLATTAEQGMIMPIDDLLVEIRENHPMILSSVEERVIYSLYDPSDDGGEIRAMGIDISDSPLLENMGFLVNERIFSIVTTTGRLENAASALALFFE